jgi:uncharacterized protein
MNRRNYELRAKVSGRQVEGLAVPYNSPTELFPGELEQIDPGAFTDSLRSNPDVLLLADHDPRRLLARSRNGGLQLDSRADGLHFDARLVDTSIADDALSLIRSGDAGGVSIGFRPLSWRAIRGGRALERGELIELSIVSSFPAYEATSVTAKARELRWRYCCGRRRT